MPQATIKLKGVKEMQAKLRALAQEFPEAVRRSLYYRGELIMTTSKQRYCPVRDGHLRNSGHVVPLPKPAIGVVLGYGGPAGIGTNSQGVGYAVIQHENLTFAHKVGEAKFLEKPLMQAVPSLPRDIAADVRKRTR